MTMASFVINSMKDLSKDLFNPLSGEDFVQMFDKNYGTQETLQGYATKGTVKDIRGDFAMVDVGLKSEGRIPLKEFGASFHPLVISSMFLLNVMNLAKEPQFCLIQRLVLKKHGKIWKKLLQKVSTQKEQLSMLFVVVILSISTVYSHLCHHLRLTINLSVMQNL
jgi:hypothetical protein